MCISPDELTTAELEQNIQDLQRFIDSNRYPESNPYWARRIEKYQEILKERADSGALID